MFLLTLSYSCSSAGAEAPLRGLHQYNDTAIQRYTHTRTASRLSSGVTHFRIVSNFSLRVLETHNKTRERRTTTNRKKMHALQISRSTRARARQNLVERTKHVARGGTQRLVSRRINTEEPSRRSQALGSSPQAEQLPGLVTAPPTPTPAAARVIHARTHTHTG